MTFAGANGNTVTATMSAFALGKDITLSNVKYNGTEVDGSGSLVITMGNGDYIATFEVTAAGNSYKGAPHFTL